MRKLRIAGVVAIALGLVVSLSQPGAWRFIVSTQGGIAIAVVGILVVMWSSVAIRDARS